jgi:hypothetical protein
MSRLQVVVDHDNVQESRRGELLALCSLRRGLEPLPPPQRERTQRMAASVSGLARELTELIVALDRPVVGRRPPI